jgi:hypothetical protein
MVTARMLAYAVGQALDFAGVNPHIKLPDAAPLHRWGQGVTPNN